MSKISETSTIAGRELGEKLLASVQEMRAGHAARVTPVYPQLHLTLECVAAPEGGFSAKVTQLPGTSAHHATASVAQARAQALALRLLADRLENSTLPPTSIVLNICK